jgi:hypothetical protein
MATSEKTTKEREELIALMLECLADAKAIVQEKKLLETQVVLSDIAIALFNARREK